MANKFETEITTTEEKKDVFYNPLDEAVNEKKYASNNVNTSGIDMTKPIDEPTFTPPPFQKKSQTPPPNAKQEKREPFNPEMKSIPKKETEMAASQMAKLIINGYEGAHDFANKGLKFSEKKLTKLQSDGEINLNAEIDYEYGKRIRAGEFFQEYNTQVDGLLKVSQEFKDEATPVLERVLAKRGVGLTDEQYLMYLFGKDIAGKSIIFFQQRQQMNYMLQTIKEATLSQQSFSQPRPQQPTPPPQDEPTPRERERRQPDPTPKSKSVKDSGGSYTLFPLFETDEEINNRETEKDSEEDEYIFNSKRKNATDNIIIEPMPKRKVGRPKK